MINKCRAAIPLLGDDKANFLPLPHKDTGHYRAVPLKILH